MKKIGALVVALALCAGVAVLLVVERSAGAGDYGAPRPEIDPCTAPGDPFPGSGLDATLQRITLSGLNGAACELGTTRERLVLSLAPGSGFSDVTWDRATVEDAVRSGLLRAVDDADDRNTIPGWAATALRFLVERAPIGWLLEQSGLGPFD